MSLSVLITGADKGLGHALVRQFLHGGFRVFAGQYLADSPIGQLSCPNSDELTVVPLDVTSIRSVREAADAVSQCTTGLDVLINSAGILSKLDGVLEEVDFDTLSRTMDVNAYGPLRVTQQFLPLLEKGQKKLIMNISSEAGSIADNDRAFWYGYCMSKAALNMQSRLLQNHLVPRGFRVLAVHPGPMRTDMLPEAARLPEEAAASIAELATNPELAGTALYVGYDGRELRF